MVVLPAPDGPVIPSAWPRPTRPVTPRIAGSAMPGQRAEISSRHSSRASDGSVGSRSSRCPGIPAGCDGDSGASATGLILATSRANAGQARTESMAWEEGSTRAVHSRTGIAATGAAISPVDTGSHAMTAIPSAAAHQVTKDRALPSPVAVAERRAAARARRSWPARTLRTASPRRLPFRSSALSIAPRAPLRVR